MPRRVTGLTLFVVFFPFLSVIDSIDPSTGASIFIRQTIPLKWKNSSLYSPINKIKP
jgi:hypothetical protein